jgi:hypothetical protein
MSQVQAPAPPRFVGRWPFAGRPPGCWMEQYKSPDGCKFIAVSLGGLYLSRNLRFDAPGVAAAYPFPDAEAARSVLWSLDRQGPPVPA